MNITYCKTILCLFACVLMNITSVAQDYPLIMNTLNSDGITFNKDAITIVNQDVLLPLSLSVVNYDGSLLIAEEQVLKIDPSNTVSRYEISLDDPEQICLAWANDLLVYKSQDNNYAKIHVLDVSTGTEINTLNIKKTESPSGRLSSLRISNDASNILFSFQFASGPMGLEHVVFDGKTFGSPQILFTYDWLSFFISSTGEKIVYQVTDNVEEPAFEIEMVDGEWMKPSSLVMEDGKFYIENLSGDGKSLLLKNGNKELLLSSYEDDQWSKPIDLGYQMSNIDHICISEDGNTIAIAGARQPIPSSQSHAIPVYDLYSLMKDANGEWQLTRLNDEESAVYRGRILLTPLGNKIFWVKQPVSELTEVSPSWMY